MGGSESTNNDSSTNDSSTTTSTLNPSLLSDFVKRDQLNNYISKDQLEELLKKYVELNELLTTKYVTTEQFNASKNQLNELNQLLTTKYVTKEQIGADNITYSSEKGWNFSGPMKTSSITVDYDLVNFDLEKQFRKNTSVKYAGASKDINVGDVLSQMGAEYIYFRTRNSNIPQPEYLDWDLDYGWNFFGSFNNDINTKGTINSRKSCIKGTTSSSKEYPSVCFTGNDEYVVTRPQTPAPGILYSNIDTIVNTKNNQHLQYSFPTSETNSISWTNFTR